MMSNFQASLRTLPANAQPYRYYRGTQFSGIENTKGEKFITFFAAIYDIRLKTMVMLTPAITRLF